MYESVGGERSIAPEIIERLKTFKLKSGRKWKAALVKLWVQGGDEYDPLLRQARNVIGPSGLYKIKL